jgi:hypothetical protein
MTAVPNPRTSQRLKEGLAKIPVVEVLARANPVPIDP